MSLSDKITIAISAISLILSLYASVNTYYEKHIKTKAYIRWVSIVKARDEGYRLNVCIVLSNMSSRPSTVSSIYLKDDNKYVESTWYPVHLSFSKDLITHQETSSFSDCTPLNIPARSSVAYIIVFQRLKLRPDLTKISMRFMINESVKTKQFSTKRLLSENRFFTAVENRLH